MDKEFVCKIPSIEEMNEKWDYEIEHNKDDRNNWIVWKKSRIEDFQKGFTIPYYGILDGKIISEATAAIKPEAAQNSDGLVGEHTAYLFAFRTIEEYQGKGYFSKLMQFMFHNLSERGFTKVTLGVEPDDERNKSIYAHYNFTEYIKRGTETYPDGTVIDVEYYGKKLEGF